jgi:hypothetical protein
MAKLLTPAPVITSIQQTDKSTCLTILQTIFSAIKTEHS